MNASPRSRCRELLCVNLGLFTLTFAACGSGDASDPIVPVAAYETSDAGPGAAKGEPCSGVLAPTYPPNDVPLGRARSVPRPGHCGDR